jgi:CheY-like chemotaxis protein
MFSMSAETAAMRPVRRTILVVDDDASNLRLCALLLRRAGYEVRTASNGAAALQSLALESPVDLLLIDVFMPEKDGFDTLTALKKSGQRIPTVVMSGGGLATSASEVLQHCRDLGAAAVLAKPFSGEDLLEKVAAILEGSHR